jgi:hypothetical protein
MIYFQAAALAAYSNYPRAGFRQRDVRFYVDLFLNWTDSTKKVNPVDVHNTQIMRFLKSMQSDGFLKIKAGRRPIYALTRPGILDLCSELAKTPRTNPVDDFLFALYFVRSYGGRLKDLVVEMDRPFPRSLQIELEAILDWRQMVSRQIQYLDLEIERLKSRIDETQKASALAMKLSKQGEGLVQIATQVSEAHPYELNYYKPMKELLTGLPNEVQIWELTQGNQLRADLLWQSYYDYMIGLKKLIQGLK